MIVYKPDAEMNRLPSFKGLSLNQISNNYRIIAAVLTVDNANSSLQIESLYYTLHVLPPFGWSFPLYLSPAST
jgi:hypothetical protein